MKPLKTRTQQATRPHEAGNVAILLALAMPIIVGFSALGAEVAYWQFTQRTAQGAADAAAFSGAAQRVQDASESAIVSAATAAAQSSGLPAARLATPLVNTPPGGGAFEGDGRAVEVMLTLDLPRHFSRYFSDSPTRRITARAVARAAGARPACVLALDRAAPEAVSFSGSSELILSGCDVASNSIAADAIDFSGSTSVTTECVSSVGGVTGEAGKLHLTDCRSPYEGTRVFADPYADLTVPPVGACDGPLKSILGVSPGTVQTVWPGTICGGAGGSTVQIKGDITFPPGTYVFDGVDLSINSTATVRGTGVTFVFTGGAEIHMNGGADIDLEAPSDDTNPYQGILFFGDPADDVSHVLNGNSATSFRGALYFPQSEVGFSGTNVAETGACTILVARTIEFTGNSFFGSDCTALGVETYETAQVVLIVE